MIEENGSKNVSVVARFRPMNEKEIHVSNETCVNFIDKKTIEISSQSENSKHKFTFDRIFNPNACQQEVFDFTAKPIVNSILEGFNGTILAYGQTSSGKTYTMQGELDNEIEEGIIPRTINLLFESIMNSPEELEFTVKSSMLEIYMEKIRDLIDVNRVNLNIREDKAKGIYIEDISEYYVSCKEEIMELIKLGSDNRAIASTNMNEASSRSHSIFIINIHQLNSKDGSAKNSKLVLVDLAGSEKISKTGATGLTLEEAKTINKSLTTLGMVINSLTDGKSMHIPYRESKLTRVLQESLGGNSKTCLIVTCSPSIFNEAESLSTLRFGNRAKNIKNKPKINKELTVGEMQIIIDNLEKKLAWATNRINTLEKYIISKDLDLPGTEKNNYKLDKIQDALKIEKVNDIDYEKIDKEDEFEKNDNYVISELQKIVNENENMIDKLKQNEILLLSKNEMLKLEISQLHEKEEIMKASSNANEFLNEVKKQHIVHESKIHEDLELIFAKSEVKYDGIKDKEVKSEFSKKIRLQQVKELELKFIGEAENKNEKEKKFILKILEDKCQKIAEQEIEIKELNEIVKITENKINPDDRKESLKIFDLEKNLIQLQNMYAQIVTQKGVVKCENQILNKKIKQRNDRINYLEKENFDLKETVSFIIKLKSKEEKYNRATIKGNFVKIIKGGHSNFLNLGKQNTLGSNSPFFTISK